MSASPQARPAEPACSVADAPAGEVVERDCRIPARDGLLLGATTFEPEGGPVGRRQAIVIASATGVKRERYRPFARFLTQRGWSVVTFDYRGIGDSRTGRVKGLAHTMYEWGAEDLAGVISWIDETWAPASIGAVAHSIGGQVVPFAANHGRLDGLLAIGSQKGYWKLWTGVGAVLCFTFFRAIPLVVRLLGYLPMRFAGCEDLPPQAALEWSRWGLHHDFVDREGRSLNGHHAAFAAPVLALSFSDDPYAPPSAVEKLLEFYGSATREHRHFHPAQFGVKAIGHSGFFIGPASQPLWEQAASWLARNLQ